MSIAVKRWIDSPFILIDSLRANSPDGLPWQCNFHEFCRTSQGSKEQHRAMPGIFSLSKCFNEKTRNKLVTGGKVMRKDIIRANLLLINKVARAKIYSMLHVDYSTADAIS